jgi:hypothetical protein
MEKTSHNEIKALTDSIKSGKRVVLLPPGIFALILSVGLLIASTVTFFGSLIALYFNDIDVSYKAIIQFGAMLILIIIVIFPALMVFQGKKNFASWSAIYALLICGLSLLILILNLLGYPGGYVEQPLAISFVTGLLAYFVIRSKSYRLLQEFFYLLKQTS